jgi:hypothetical protein
VGRGAGLPATSVGAPLLATPLATIGRGMRGLTPGQLKVAELRNATVVTTTGHMDSPGSSPATQMYPTGGRVSPASGSRIPVKTTKTPPQSPGTTAKNKTKRPATVVPTLSGGAPGAPPVTQTTFTVAPILDASAASFIPRTVMTPAVTTAFTVNVGAGTQTQVASTSRDAPRAPRSRASSVSVSNTTVINMLEALQAQIAALGQPAVPAVSVPTENLLYQLDDGDMSSVSEHRTRHWVARANGQGLTYDGSGVRAAGGMGLQLAQPGSTSVHGAASSVVGGGPGVSGAKSASVPKGKKAGTSGVSFPAHAPTIPAVILDSRPLVYNGESAVSLFLAQFQYTAELRG